MVVSGDRLTPVAKLLLAVEILGAYARARWQVRRADLRDAVSALRSDGANCRAGLPASNDSQAVAERLGAAVRRTLRILPTDSRCLIQSLVLSRLLSARGISSTLVIGACPKPEFAAHAWVEHHGRPVLPPGAFYDSRLVEL